MKKLFILLVLLTAPLTIRGQDLIIRRGTGTGNGTDTNAIANNNGSGTNGLYYGITTNYGTIQGSNATFFTLVSSNTFRGSNGTFLNLSVSNSFNGSNATLLSLTVSNQVLGGITTVAVTGTSNTIVDCALGNAFRVVASDNLFLVFSNVPSTNFSYTATLEVMQDATGARTIHSAGMTNFQYTNSVAATNLTALINTNAGQHTIISFKNSSWTNGQVIGVINPL